MSISEEDLKKISKQIYDQYADSPPNQASSKSIEEHLKKFDPNSTITISSSTTTTSGTGGITFTPIIWPSSGGFGTGSTIISPNTTSITLNPFYPSFGGVDPHSAFILSFLQCHQMYLCTNGKPDIDDQHIIANLSILAFTNAKKILPLILPVFSKYFSKNSFDTEWMLMVNYSDMLAIQAMYAGAKLYYLIHEEVLQTHEVVKNLALYKSNKPLQNLLRFEDIIPIDESETLEIIKNIFEQFQQINPFKSL